MRFRSKSRRPPTHNQGVLGSSPSGTTDKSIENQAIKAYLNRLISLCAISLHKICTQVTSSMKLRTPVNAKPLHHPWHNDLQSR